ncbi:DUF6893 family small protein [Geodermatophilus sp. YIM 151500]
MRGPLLLLTAGLGAAALLRREYPAIVRYLKIRRM